VEEFVNVTMLKWRIFDPYVVLEVEISQLLKSRACSKLPCGKSIYYMFMVIPGPLRGRENVGFRTDQICRKRQKVVVLKELT
jgi:hypothetical protein